MADSVTSSEGLKDILKPFHQRASEAEDRLSSLEVVFSNSQKKGAQSELCSERVRELELKLEEVIAELALEREKVAKLTVQNEKKDYRITHIVRALRENDRKLEKMPVLTQKQGI